MCGSELGIAGGIALEQDMTASKNGPLAPRLSLIAIRNSPKAKRQLVQAALAAAKCYVGRSPPTK